MSLFDGMPDSPAQSSRGSLHAMPGAPLAERMRPRTLDEYVGQELAYVPVLAIVSARTMTGPR